MTDLRAIAEAATPGPWEYIPCSAYVMPHGRARHIGPMVTGAADLAHGGGVMQFRGGTTTEDIDAMHIAAWSPDRALAALDVIEAARRANKAEWAQRINDDMNRLDPRWNAGVDEWRAADTAFRDALARWDALP